VVFYVSVVYQDKPLPPGAFGLTNRPDELLHLVIDALEPVRLRRRPSAVARWRGAMAAAMLTRERR